MKILARILSLVVLVSAATLYMGCGGDDPEGKSEEETQLDKLKGTWDLTYVELDTEERLDFVNVTMTISGDFVKGGSYSYTLIGDSFPAQIPLPKSGTVKFGSNPVTQLIRTEGGSTYPITYSLTNSDQTLTIEFNYTGAGYVGSRVNEVEGNWKFVFEKQ